MDGKRLVGEIVCHQPSPDFRADRAAAKQVEKARNLSLSTTHAQGLSRIEQAPSPAGKRGYNQRHRSSPYTCSRPCRCFASCLEPSTCETPNMSTSPGGTWGSCARGREHPLRTLGI